jgi:hypothetical protein
VVSKQLSASASHWYRVYVSVEVSCSGRLGTNRGCFVRNVRNVMEGTGVDLRRESPAPSAGLSHCFVSRG